MSYLALGVAALAFFLWVTNGRRVLKRREWRFISAAAAVVAFTAAVYMGLRGAWGSAIVLVVCGLWLAGSTRRVNPSGPGREAMSETEARSVLGVAPGATREEVQAAYARLMRLAHPDKGGTAGLAAQLNAARDRLLKR